MGSCSHEHHNALHGVHDHPNVEQRLAEAESLCAATGARLTPLRKEVLELILNASGPMGAYDLLAKIKNNSDRPAAPPTVYRTLDFLLEKGFKSSHGFNASGLLASGQVGFRLKDLKVPQLVNIKLIRIKLRNLISFPPVLHLLVFEEV